MQYWLFSKLQLPLSLAQTFHCLPSTVHLASAARLDDDTWDELLDAIELGARLEAGALDAGLDAAGVDDPPPPPPQAVNTKVIPRQIAPVANLVELFIRTPSLLSFWIMGL
jgi:hypothetical protein